MPLNAFAQNSASIPKQNSKTITLLDGTKVKGEIIRFENGTYSIHSPTLGDIQIQDTNVVSITTGDTVEPAEKSAAANLSKDFIQAQQAAVMRDPALMEDLMKLSQDPQFMELLNDPAFVEAVQNSDVEKLQNHPKTLMLMNNPQIKGMIEKIQQKNGYPNVR